MTGSEHLRRLVNVKACEIAIPIQVELKNLFYAGKVAKLLSQVCDLLVKRISLAFVQLCKPLEIDLIII